ncbi:MAG: cation:dicarboxylate symporter family transporter [Megasphaera sp.]
MHSLWSALNRISLIKQIIVGLIIGIAVALGFPAAARELSLLGVIFVGALKGIAPVLVFVLVASALSRKQENHESKIKDVIILYLIGTFLAAFFAVMISYVFPLTLQLDVSAADNKAPEGIAEVLTTLLKNIVDNPVHALMTGNYIGILGWAVLFGVAVRRVSATKAVLDDCANAVTTCVQWVIRLAPSASWAADSFLLTASKPSSAMLSSPPRRGCSLPSSSIRSSSMPSLEEIPIPWFGSVFRPAA